MSLPTGTSDYICHFECRVGSFKSPGTICECLFSQVIGIKWLLGY